MDGIARKIVRNHVDHADGVFDQIDSQDEMFLYDLDESRGDRRRTAVSYFTIGSRIFRGIKQIAEWRFGSLSNVESFLDFACGYGRSTRYLVRELDPSRVWASDIYTDAVKFQERNYGVHVIPSVPDPADYPTDKKFDFIFASSFFSHMPLATFGPWLRVLYDLLTPRGVLVFSAADIELLPPSIQPRPKGHWFTAHSESRGLDKEQYGGAFVDEEFVVEQVKLASRGQGSVHRIPKGLVTFQDLYVVVADPTESFSDLHFAHDPSGHIDYCRPTEDGGFEISGWAIDRNPGGEIQEVQVLSDGESVATLAPSLERADVAEYFRLPGSRYNGWVCHLKPHQVGPHRVFGMKVKNDRGCENIYLFNEPVPESIPATSEAADTFAGDGDVAAATASPGQAFDPFVHLGRLEKWWAAHGDEQRIFNLGLNKDSLVYDLGGFDGGTSHLLFREYGCEIHVFEPSPEFCGKIRDRFEGNPRIHVHQFGLGGHARDEVLHIAAEGSSLFDRPHTAIGDTSGQVAIRIECAADFLAKQGAEKIDLMKINIEGGEYELLDHLLTSGWVPRIRNIQIQFHEDVIPDSHARMHRIQKSLARTHHLTFQHEFVWENWALND